MNEIYERENAWKASVRKMEELLRKGHSLAIDLLNVYNLYKYDIQETPIRNIFEQHEIRLLSDDCSFEEYKVKVQNIILETKQNQQEVYNHIVGSPKNKRMIKNFIKYHKDILEESIRKYIDSFYLRSIDDDLEDDDLEDDDLKDDDLKLVDNALKLFDEKIMLSAKGKQLLHSIMMLSEVLIEETNLDLYFAIPVVKQTIFFTVLKNWATSYKYKKEFKIFIKELNTKDIDECMTQYTKKYRDSSFEELTAFYLYLYKIKLDFNTNLVHLSSELRKFYDEYHLANEKVEEEEKRAEKRDQYKEFKKSLLTYVEPNREIRKCFTIDDIDLMNGTEFEEYIAKLFDKMGYETEVTKQSNDQGIDVIAEKDNLRIGIQAKRYSGTVSNSAIQCICQAKNGPLISSKNGPLF